MSYIDKLLQGEKVQWKTLGEVCEFQNGFAFQSSLFKATGLPIVRITNIDGVNVDLTDVKYFVPEDYKSGNPLNYSIEKGDILIAMSGATTGKIGYYNLDETAYLNQRVGKFIPNKELLNSRFLYHFLLTKADFLYVLAGGGAQPNLSSNNLKEKLQIPIPPLEVQEKIVGILDKFTELTAELTEELTARKQQYEYYRNKLLTFNENGGGYKWLIINDITMKTSNIRWKNNDNSYHYIDLTSVSRDNNSIIETSEINANNAPSRAQKLVLENDVIFATTRPTQQRLCLINEEYSGEIASTGYCVLRAKIDDVLPKWIFFNLSTTDFKNYVEENQSGSAYPAISDAKVKEYKIPVPPIEEQERIVGILDKFDALVNDISIGLPAEIKMRQQQYEYYRDLLLTFPPNSLSA